MYVVKEIMPIRWKGEPIRLFSFVYLRKQNPRFSSLVWYFLVSSLSHWKSLYFLSHLSSPFLMLKTQLIFSMVGLCKFWLFLCSIEKVSVADCFHLKGTETGSSISSILLYVCLLFTIFFLLAFLGNGTKGEGHIPFICDSVGPNGLSRPSDWYGFHMLNPIGWSGVWSTWTTVWILPVGNFYIIWGNL